MAVLAPPTPEDVRSAAARIESIAHRTPVLTSRRLDERVGAHVHLKCENFQRVGAFKFRGAVNAISQLGPQERAAGVVAYSSGNHAQAIALAAATFQVPATIVMPHDAPRGKLAATRGYGADVVLYDRYTEDRREIGARIAAERGATVIPPYDYPHIIAGQGTATLELLAEVNGRRGQEVDVLVAPLGGGGLLAGAVLAARAAGSAATIYGVEPAAGDDGRRSLEAGEIVRIDTPRTIADGAQTQFLGDLTFPIIAGGVEQIVTVPDEALIEAMRWVAESMKLVIEPTGALGLAALLTGQIEVADRAVGVIVSGGNVDIERYAELIGSSGTP